MSEIGPAGDAKSGATASGESHSPSEPPGSQRGFIGTNIDAAQAYIPPTSPLETPEPPVPNTRVALSADVDPRKAPTSPNLKKAAQAVLELERARSGEPERARSPELERARSLELERARPLEIERKRPIVEAPPDSQSSGVRRGAGYAPSRSNFPPPTGSSSRLEPPSRNTPVKPMPRVSARPPAAARTAPAQRTSAAPEPTETPAQRRAALLLIFLFAALLAIAVYFFLRRAPSPSSEEPAASASTSVSAAPPSAAPSPSVAPEPQPSASATASVSASAPASVQNVAPFVPHVAEPANEPGPAAPAPPHSAAAAPSASAAPAASGPDKQKSDRWF